MNAREEQRDELFNLWLKHGTCVESDSSEGKEFVEAILAAGYRRPPVIENDKLVIDDGMLLLEVGACTCTPYGSSHEAFCGYEYLDDLTGPLARAGYRKLEPKWAETLTNDGTYEYTISSDCDGSNVQHWRRTPGTACIEEASPWESYVPEVTS